MRAGLGVLLATVAVLASCGGRAPSVAPASALEARYRLAAQRSGITASVSTSVYRQLLSRSLFARCKMVPGDSQMFDARVQRCGVVKTVILGIARLFLERAATPEYLRPVHFEGHLRWVDLPDSSRCR